MLCKMIYVHRGICFHGKIVRSRIFLSAQSRKRETVLLERADTREAGKHAMRKNQRVRNNSRRYSQLLPTTS